MFEKKRGKRFLASVMALIMLLSLAPVGALATEDEGQPAENQAVVDEDKNTPTEPTGDSDSAEATKSEGGLDEGFNNVDADTSNNDSGIVMHRNGPGNGGNNSANLDNRFYIAILQEENPESFIGNEPQAAVNAGFWFVGKSPSDDYTITGDTTNAFDNNYESYINEDTFRNHSNYQNLWESQNVEAIADPSGVDLNGIVTNIDTDKIIEAYLVRSGNGSENVSDYTLIPYVIKHENYVNNNSTGGWHIDCQVVKKERVKNISNFTKSVVTSENGLPTDIKSTGYTFPENGSVTFSESTTSVTLLYKLTVTGAKDANFTITDESATLVSGSLTGTIPEAGNVDVYVSRTFSANDIKNGYLVNTATIAPNDDNLTKVDDGKSEATAKTPATKPETPTQTKTVKAKYFVLMPSKGTPTSGKDQGVKNYFPNASNNGGVQYSSNLTGYKGNISASIIEEHPEANTKDGYFVANGVDSKYLVVPSNLGYFSEGYSGTFPSTLGDNFSMQGKQIIWYVVKNEGTKVLPDYHVDGYLAGIPVTLTYHDNFTGSNDSYTQNGLKSGETASIAEDGTVSESKTFSHAGYVFEGWYDNVGCTGTNYAGQTHTMMDNLNLYAKWKKEDSPKQSYTLTVNYIYENGNEAQRPHVEQVEEGTPYTVTSPLIVGYTSDQTVVNGTMPNHDVNVNVRYKANEYTVTYYVNGQLWNADAQKYTVGQSVNVRPDFPKEGYQFSGWSSTDVQIENRAFTMPAKDVIINGSYTKVLNPDPLTYTINQHFMNGKGTEITKQYKEGTSQTGTNTDVLKNLILDTMKANQSDAAGNTYVYVAEKTTFKVEEATLTENDFLVNNTVIDLYYYLDVIGDKDEKGNDKGDKIPDCYQVTIIYKSSDESKGTVSTKKEVLTIKKADNEKILLEDAKIKGSKATDNGGRNYFSNWTDEVNNKTINDATLTADTIKTAIETAEGGETYTFTANFGYSGGGGSGGSSRPSTPPTVDIPDDVPTGLNGKDHYAYIIGYGNNDVRPQNNITRAEVATIFFRLLTDETREANMTKSNGYNDVKDGDWFCCAVSTLSKMGIIKGYEDGSFKPNDPISRAEFAAIAARFDPDGDKTPATFADVTSHWAKDEISIAANHGWIKGYEDGSFKPDQKITRAETMTLVNRVLNRLPETKDDLHKDMKTWVDNMDETAWYYLAVQEATNSHYFKNKTGTKFEQWTDLRDTRDWSELEK